MVFLGEFQFVNNNNVSSSFEKERQWVVVCLSVGGGRAEVDEELKEQERELWEMLERERDENTQ